MNRILELRIAELEDALKAQRQFWPMKRACWTGVCSCGSEISYKSDVFCKDCAVRMGRKALGE